VLCVVRVSDFSTALDLVNQHEYGNGTAIFTRDRSIARGSTRTTCRSAWSASTCRSRADGLPQLRRLEALAVRPAAHARPDGIRFYTRMKTITARWPTGIRAGAEFSMPTMK